MGSNDQNIQDIDAYLKIIKTIIESSDENSEYTIRENSLEIPINQEQPRYSIAIDNDGKILISQQANNSMDQNSYNAFDIHTIDKTQASNLIDAAILLHSATQDNSPELQDKIQPTITKLLNVDSAFQANIVNALNMLIKKKPIETAHTQESELAIWLHNIQLSILGGKTPIFYTNIKNADKALYVKSEVNQYHKIEIIENRLTLDTFNSMEMQQLKEIQDTQNKIAANKVLFASLFYNIVNSQQLNPEDQSLNQLLKQTSDIYSQIVSMQEMQLTKETQEAQKTRLTIECFNAMEQLLTTNNTVPTFHVDTTDTDILYVEFGNNQYYKIEKIADGYIANKLNKLPEKQLKKIDDKKDKIAANQILADGIKSIKQEKNKDSKTSQQQADAIDLETMLDGMQADIAQMLIDTVGIEGTFKDIDDFTKKVLENDSLPLNTNTDNVEQPFQNEAVYDELLKFQDQTENAILLEIRKIFDKLNPRYAAMSAPDVNIKNIQSIWFNISNINDWLKESGKTLSEFNLNDDNNISKIIQNYSNKINNLNHITPLGFRPFLEKLDQAIDNANYLYVKEILKETLSLLPKDFVDVDRTKSLPAFYYNSKTSDIIISFPNNQNIDSHGHNIMEPLLTEYTKIDVDKPEELINKNLIAYFNKQANQKLTTKDLNNILSLTEWYSFKEDAKEKGMYVSIANNIAAQYYASRVTEAQFLEERTKLVYPNNLLANTIKKYVNSIEQPKQAENTENIVKEIQQKVETLNLTGITTFKQLARVLQEKDALQWQKQIIDKAGAINDTLENTIEFAKIMQNFQKESNNSEDLIAFKQDMNLILDLKICNLLEATFNSNSITVILNNLSDLINLPTGQFPKSLTLLAQKIQNIECKDEATERSLQQFFPSAEEKDIKEILKNRIAIEEHAQKILQSEPNVGNFITKILATKISDYLNTFVISDIKTFKEFLENQQHILGSTIVLYKKPVLAKFLHLDDSLNNMLEFQKILNDHSYTLAFKEDIQEMLQTKIDEKMLDRKRRYSDSDINYSDYNTQKQNPNNDGNKIPDQEGLPEGYFNILDENIIINQPIPGNNEETIPWPNQPDMELPAKLNEIIIPTDAKELDENPDLETRNTTIEQLKEGNKNSGPITQPEEQLERENSEEDNRQDPNQTIQQKKQQEEHNNSNKDDKFNVIQNHAPNNSGTNNEFNENQNNRNPLRQQSQDGEPQKDNFIDNSDQNSETSNTRDPEDMNINLNDFKEDDKQRKRSNSAVKPPGAQFTKKEDTGFQGNLEEKKLWLPKADVNSINPDSYCSMKIQGEHDMYAIIFYNSVTSQYATVTLPKNGISAYFKEKFNVKPVPDENKQVNSFMILGLLGAVVEYADTKLQGGTNKDYIKQKLNNSASQISAQTNQKPALNSAEKKKYTHQTMLNVDKLLKAMPLSAPEIKQSNDMGNQNKQINQPPTEQIFKNTSMALKDFASSYPEFGKSYKKSLTQKLEKTKKSNSKSHDTLDTLEKLYADCPDKASYFKKIKMLFTKRSKATTATSSNLSNSIQKPILFSKESRRHSSFPEFRNNSGESVQKIITEQSEIKNNDNNNKFGTAK